MYYVFCLCLCYVDVLLTVLCFFFDLFFFFKQKTAYEMRVSDWSSDVCSSDLQWLWYSLLKARPTSPRVRFDEEVSAMSNRRRSTTEAEVEFYLRGPDGHSIKVMTRPSSDRMAMRSEEHTSELQSLMRISYAVFCLKQKNTKNITTQAYDILNSIHTNIQ